MTVPVRALMLAFLYLFTSASFSLFRGPLCATSATITSELDMLALIHSRHGDGLPPRLV